MTLVLGSAALLASLAWLAGIIWFLRHFRPPAVAVQGRVTLLLAVTGRTDGLLPLPRNAAPMFVLLIARKP